MSGSRNRIFCFRCHERCLLITIYCSLVALYEGEDAISAQSANVCKSSSLNDSSVVEDALVTEDSMEPKIGRPCGCQWKRPSLENMRDCLNGPGRDSGHSPVDTSLPASDKRVFVVSSLNRRVEDPTRFGIALTAAHLAAYGHAFNINKQKDVYRKGVLRLGSMKDDRIAQVKLLEEELNRLLKEDKVSFGWLLWLDPDVAIVTDEDILRRVLSSSAMDTKTHIIVCRHGLRGLARNSSIPNPPFDSGIVLLKNAKWTTGFLQVWQRELSVLKSNHSDDIDMAFTKAVKLARDLGGQTAVIELEDGDISTRPSAQKDLTVREVPIVHLRGIPDEVSDHFFHATWTWSCRRPGGLGGGMPAKLQRFHREALTDGVHRLLSAPSPLHLGGRKLEPGDHVDGVLSALAEYSPVLAKEAVRDGQGSVSATLALRMLKLLASGFQFAKRLDHPKALQCRDFLHQLNLSK